jgi:hypothetical protein
MYIGPFREPKMSLSGGRTHVFKHYPVLGGMLHGEKGKKLHGVWAGELLRGVRGKPIISLGMSVAVAEGSLPQTYTDLHGLTRTFVEEEDATTDLRSEIRDLKSEKS